MIDGLSNGIDFEITVTRDEFEKLAKPTIDRAKKVLDNLFDTTKVNKKFIDEVIIVGGGSRIPVMQDMLKNFFGKELN